MGTWSGHYGCYMFADGPIQDLRSSLGTGNVILVGSQGNFYYGMTLVSTAYNQVGLRQIIIFVLGNKARSNRQSHGVVEILACLSEMRICYLRPMNTQPDGTAEDAIDCALLVQASFDISKPAFQPVHPCLQPALACLQPALTFLQSALAFLQSTLACFQPTLAFLQPGLAALEFVYVGPQQHKLRGQLEQLFRKYEAPELVSQCRVLLQRV